MRVVLEPTRQWPAAAVWIAATDVVASAYGVDVEQLRAPSRGRGPRPPERVREPKKVAIYLTAVLSGWGCRRLARHLGMDRATVAIHCAEVRGWSDDDQVELNVQLLAAAVSVKLGLSDARSSDRTRRTRSCDLGKAAA
jgi:hypothetical protein